MATVLVQAWQTQCPACEYRTRFLTGLEAGEIFARSIAGRNHAAAEPACEMTEAELELQPIAGGTAAARGGRRRWEGPQA